HSAAAPRRETVRHPLGRGRGGRRPATGNDLTAEEGTLMSSRPAAVQADDIATSRLRTHVLRSGPGGGTANPEMVRRIAAGDPGAGGGAATRRALPTLVGR